MPAAATRRSVSIVISATLVSVLAGLASAAPREKARVTPKAKGPVRELVVAGEGYRLAGKFLEQNLEDLLRRLEEITGWPAGSLKGKAFVRPREALEYMRTNRVSFAILPLHQFAQGRRELALEPLAQLVPPEGTELAYWGIARRDTWTGDIHERPGLRLAITEAHDPQWIRVLFEAELDPATHFKLVEVPSGEEAVAALLGKRADLAMLNEVDFQAIKERTGEKGDLKWIYTSGIMAPPPLVAVGKYVSKADKATLAGAIKQLCRDKGAPACSRMGIMYVNADQNDRYRHIVSKYETYR
jgi:ABC-type phosphate/phosphonate transport system substrate-binding protein